MVVPDAQNANAEPARDSVSILWPTNRCLFDLDHSIALRHCQSVRRTCALPVTALLPAQRLQPRCGCPNRACHAS